MLPTAGSQADGKSGSFQNMLSKYGLASSVAAGQYNIAAAPLYFVRSGYLNPNDGKSWNAGIYGYWWSSRAAAYTSSTSATAYHLEFHESTVYPSGEGRRYVGRPLRCLSTVLDM